MSVICSHQVPYVWLKCTKFNFRRAPDPAGGAYSAPRPLAGREGAIAPPQEPHPALGPLGRVTWPLGPRLFIPSTFNLASTILVIIIIVVVVVVVVLPWKTDCQRGADTVKFCPDLIRYCANDTQVDGNAISSRCVEDLCSVDGYAGISHLIDHPYPTSPVCHIALAVKYFTSRILWSLYNFCLIFSPTKLKPGFTQQTQAPANRNAPSKQWQPWLAACQRKRLRFLRFSFTQRTQR